MATEVAERTYTIDISEQVADQLLTSADLVDFLQSKLRVNNCKRIAAAAVRYTDNGTSVEVSSNKGNIGKKDMKQYIKRFLRNKQLSNFIKVHAEGVDGLSLKYINKVDEDEQ